jgi:hypothetical protein
MMNRRCLSCDYFRDSCNGKPGDCLRHRAIDFERACSGLHVFKDAERSVKKLPVWKPEESRRDKFKRIGKKRQEQALEAIRKLEHLTSRYYRQRTHVTAYTYEWTAEDALVLILPIEEALEKLRSELISPDMPREHGLIEDIDAPTNRVQPERPAQSHDSL